MKNLVIVQVAQIKNIAGKDRVINFCLGVYSNKNNAMTASAKHAIEINKNGGNIIKWEASGQQGYTENCTYTLYTRSLNVDCLQEPQTSNPPRIIERNLMDALPALNMRVK